MKNCLSNKVLRYGIQFHVQVQATQFSQRKFNMAAALKPPSELLKKGNLGENWRQWRQNFEIYLIAAQIDVKDNQTIRALFLHVIGQYGRDIYNDIVNVGSETDMTLQELFDVFEKYCNPKSNLTYNRYKFFHTNQAKNEPFDKFLSSLQRQSKDCEFGDLNNSLMVTQIVSGIKNTTLRERLLKSDLNLNEVIDECRTTEKSEVQAQQMQCTSSEKPTPLVAKPKQEKKHFNKDHKPKGPKTTKEGWEKVDLKNCKFCGGSHVYGNCPAFGSVCSKCCKPNHFSIVCKN